MNHLCTRLNARDSFQWTIWLCNYWCTKTSLHLPSFPVWCLMQTGYGVSTSTMKCLHIILAICAQLCQCTGLVAVARPTLDLPSPSVYIRGVWSAHMFYCVICARSHPGTCCTELVKTKHATSAATSSLDLPSPQREHGAQPTSCAVCARSNFNLAWILGITSPKMAHIVRFVHNQYQICQAHWDLWSYTWLDNEGDLMEKKASTTSLLVYLDSALVVFIINRIFMKKTADMWTTHIPPTLENCSQYSTASSTSPFPTNRCQSKRINIDMNSDCCSLRKARFEECNQSSLFRKELPSLTQTLDWRLFEYSFALWARNQAALRAT